MYSPFKGKITQSSSIRSNLWHLVDHPLLLLWILSVNALNIIHFSSSHRKHNGTALKVIILMMEVCDGIRRTSGWQICDMSAAMLTSLKNNGIIFCWVCAWPQNPFLIQSPAVSSTYQNYHLDETLSWSL